MQRPPIKIRRATINDLDTIVSFNEALALETEDKSLNHETLQAGVRAALGDPTRCNYWLAETGDRIAGQTMVTVEWSDWRNGFFWWIQSVYIAAAFRRQGVFRTIYRHVQAEAKADADVCGIRLYVYGSNERAMETYRSLGMVESNYRLFEETW